MCCIVVDKVKGEKTCNSEAYIDEVGCDFESHLYPALRKLSRSDFSEKIT